MKASPQTGQPENPMKRLRSRLFNAGVSPDFLNENVLPSWWDESLAASPGGFREAVGYISAYLGFSLKSLIDPNTPLVMSSGSCVKYKRSATVAKKDISLATQIGISLAHRVASSFEDDSAPVQIPAALELRDKLLKLSDKSWLGLRHILNACWEMGVAVAFARNLPCTSKPDAMAIMAGNRPVIVVMCSMKYPSWIAFIVAHELGHFFHKHLSSGQTLVDEKLDSDSLEKEEVEANEYAKLLLTGRRELGWNPKAIFPATLARSAEALGEKYKISPGVALLSNAFTTKEWKSRIAALNRLEKGEDASRQIQTTMNNRINGDMLSRDALEWINRITGNSE